MTLRIPDSNRVQSTLMLAETVTLMKVANDRCQHNPPYDMSVKSQRIKEAVGKEAKEKAASATPSEYMVRNGLLLLCSCSLSCFCSFFGPCSCV